ncbi:MAG: hypothetical protein IIX07_09270, partial [Lachnospiraceae bacterium]|nr:hypothetical protein [Lachnospiraceae bacterium]
MEILRESKELFDYLVKARRQFHENPELSGEEWETLKYIRNELDGVYAGFRTVEEDVLTQYVSQVLEGLSTGAFTYLAHPDL